MNEMREITGILLEKLQQQLPGLYEVNLAKHDYGDETIRLIKDYYLVLDGNRKLPGVSLESFMPTGDNIILSFWRITGESVLDDIITTVNELFLTIDLLSKTVLAKFNQD